MIIQCKTKRVKKLSINFLYSIFSILVIQALLLSPNNLKENVNINQISKFSSEKSFRETSNNQALINGKYIEITNLSLEKTSFIKNENFSVFIDIKNSQDFQKNKNLFLGCSLISPSLENIDLPMKELYIDKKNNKIKYVIDLKKISPDKLYSGDYSIIFSVWEKENNNFKRLSTINKKNFFKVYSFVDDFKSINSKIWYSREGKLGESKLMPDNVFSKNNNLMIKIPKNSLNGGEIKTLKMNHYGSYEIKMKLPNAPSSITGFFLYKEPDFEHEIDIEIFNKPKSKLLLTTHYQGRSPEKEYSKDLSFDPTADFNVYKINYYPNKLEFYVNDKLYQTWKNGYSKEPMYLYLNTWYPSWLEKTPSKKDTYLEVDWIKY